MVSIEQMLEHMGDTYSKKMYENRLLYSITRNSDYIKRIVEMTVEGKQFVDRLQHVDKCFIFGAGTWGG